MDSQSSSSNDNVASSCLARDDGHVKENPEADNRVDFTGASSLGSQRENLFSRYITEEMEEDEGEEKEAEKMKSMQMAVNIRQSITKDHFHLLKPAISANINLSVNRKDPHKPFDNDDRSSSFELPSAVSASNSTSSAVLDPCPESSPMTITESLSAISNFGNGDDSTSIGIAEKPLLRNVAPSPVPAAATADENFAFSQFHQSSSPFSIKHSPRDSIDEPESREGDNAGFYLLSNDEDIRLDGSGKTPPSTEKNAAMEVAGVGEEFGFQSVTVASSTDEQSQQHKGLLNRLIAPAISGDLLCNDERISEARKLRKKRDMLDYPTDSESETEVPKVSGLWENAELESSDAESVDLELKEPFQHATVYTEEEAIMLIRNKLIRLQNLYIKEYRKIICNMKEKQREYATLMKKEREVYGPLQKPRNLSSLVDEQRKYNKLKALSQYQKHGNGPETLLFKKMIEHKKVATSQLYSRSRIFNKCVYTEGGMRCNVKVVPGSRYCMKHILKDTGQLLFRACGVRKDDYFCEEPVSVIFEDARCPLHKPVPSVKRELLPEQ